MALALTLDSFLTLCFCECTIIETVGGRNHTKHNMTETVKIQVSEENSSEWPSKQGRQSHSLWHTHDFQPHTENKRYYAYCKICKKVIKTTAVKRLLKHRFSPFSYNNRIQYFYSNFIFSLMNRRRCNKYTIQEHHTNDDSTTTNEESHENERIAPDALMENGDGMTARNAVTKMEQIFLHSGSESDVNPIVRQRDALSVFFQSVETQTRNLPIHLQLVAKRKISNVIFDLEERHICETNQYD